MKGHAQGPDLGRLTPPTLLQPIAHLDERLLAKVPLRQRTAHAFGHKERVIDRAAALDELDDALDLQTVSAAGARDDVPDLGQDAVGAADDGDLVPYARVILGEDGLALAHDEDVHDVGGEGVERHEEDVAIRRTSVHHAAQLPVADRHQAHIAWADGRQCLEPQKRHPPHGVYHRKPPQQRKDHPGLHRLLPRLGWQMLDHGGDVEFDGAHRALEAA